MSDGRRTIGGASSGFNSDNAKDHRQQARTIHPQRRNSRLRVQVRQKAREVGSSQVWNTYCLKLDAHKPTGERHVSTRTWASSGLLGGRRTLHQYTHEQHTTGGSIDA